MVFLSHILKKQYQRPKSMKQQKSLFSKYKGLSSSIILVSGISLAVGVAILFPYFAQDYFKEKQQENRRGINQDSVQPGGMRIWSDPYKPR